MDPPIPSLIILGQCPLVSELSKSRTLAEAASVQEGEERRVVREVRVSGANVMRLKVYRLHKLQACGLA